MPVFRLKVHFTGRKSATRFLWVNTVSNRVVIAELLVIIVFSERERRYMSSSVCLSVTFVHPTQAIEIFRNVSMPFGMLAIC